jgi:hypothetical protein
LPGFMPRTLLKEAFGFFCKINQNALERNIV